MKRLFFILMVALWGAFLAVAFTSPDVLTGIWDWSRDLSWLPRIVVWVLFLPWMIGLWVWHADWSFATRLAVIVVLALGWSAASFPRK